MAKTFMKLTRLAMRQLTAGEKLVEHGITFERPAHGDGIFTVNVMVDGQRIHRLIGRESDGATRTQAEEFMAKVRIEARQGRLNLLKGRKVLGFAQAAADYLGRIAEEGGKDFKMKAYRLSHHLVPHFRVKPLSKLTTLDIEDYKKTRLAGGAAPGSVNRELAVLSHLFTKAGEWSWLDHRPAVIRRLKEDKGRIIYLLPDQAANLLDAAKGDQCWQVYLFIVIGLETAMRRMEILSIRLEHIDLEKQVIYIPQAKAGAREQPITEYLADFLRGYVQAAGPGQEWLFPAASASGHTVSIERAFRRVVVAAGLDPKEVVRHTLRHTAITHLVQAGIDLPTVQRISGHKTLQMVVRYAHQSGEHIRAAMTKLERRYRPLAVVKEEMKRENAHRARRTSRPPQ